MTTILIIEDSRTQAEQIATMLQDITMSVVIASDGPEGLHIAATQKIDCIILDIELPTMDGFQICRRLRRDPLTSAVPIIMLTDKTHPKAVRAGVEAGADDYISKDIFAAEHLINTLQSLGIME